MFEAMIQDAAGVFEAAVRGVQADHLLSARSSDDWSRRPLSAYRRVVVAAFGKAALAMGGVVEARLGDRLDEGVVVVNEGAEATLPARLPRPQRMEVIGGGHPQPTEGSVRGARRVLELAAGCGDEDLFLVLVSGGGSSLCTDFEGGLTLDEARAIFDLLLRSGADIHAMNAVRKHLSRIGGGRLARAAAPAEVAAFVISDVPGDDLSVIASGPTVPDPTTFADAVEVVRAHGLWERLPGAARAYLERGLVDPALETPGPGHPLFERVDTRIVGRNQDALEAAAAEAVRRGYAARIVSGACTGEAREVGRRLAREAVDAAGGPVCLLWGGETTVTVRGGGRGGRNQELALAAALELDGAGREVVLLSGGTDGIDGPTDAAGACVTPETAARARAGGLDPAAFLADNDAWSFFEAAGGLLKPGPTHTNVMDVQIALVR